MKEKLRRAYGILRTVFSGEIVRKSLPLPILITGPALFAVSFSFPAGSNWRERFSCWKEFLLFGVPGVRSRLVR